MTQRTLALVVVLSSGVGCTVEQDDLFAAAERWAAAICAKQEECECAPVRCMETRRAQFLRWMNGDVPSLTCTDERISEVSSLTCAESEAGPFDWETRSCPLWTNFSGLNEPCRRPVGADGGPFWCENGLVCDYATMRCASSIPPPGEGLPCLMSSEIDRTRGLCSEGLHCTSGICEIGSPPSNEDASIVCDGGLFAL